MKLFKGTDWYLPLTALIIGIFSLFLLLGLVPRLFLSQLIFWVLGFGLFFLLSLIEFRTYKGLTWLFYGVSLFLLILTFALGEVSRGAVRWIQIGQFTIQFSEIVKPFLLIFFAFFLASWDIRLSRLFVSFLLFLIPAFLIFKQPDLGSTLILGTALLGILFFSLSFIRLLVIGLGSLIFLPLFWFLLANYQKQRVLTFLNPNADPLGAGYNLIQAMISVGSGQIVGRGLGRGTQSHLAFLPEQHTDFIFAAFAEEMGLVGCLLLLGLYVLLLWRVLKIAKGAKEDPERLFCAGVFLMLLFQIFVNVGMNLGLVPITGVTLPLFSYGGSSLLATMICLGVIESIAKHQKKQEFIEIK